MNDQLMKLLQDQKPKLGAIVGGEPAELSKEMIEAVPGLQIISGEVGLAESFPDESFDFVFINETTQEAVKTDLDVWYGRVKTGGLILGSGYAHKTKGVEIALAEAFNLLHLYLMPDGIWCLQR